MFVQTKRETELSKYMIPKKELDTSNMLVSPMPGALVSVAVKPGDEVSNQKTCLLFCVCLKHC